MRRFGNVSGVVRWRLCVGCGACAYVCPESNIELRDVKSEGIRPLLKSESCRACGTCLSVCPGLGIGHPEGNGATGRIQELSAGWGTVGEVLEGYAADPEIRFQGSSGGLITALALFCLEQAGMAGALHIGADSARPWKNSPVISRNRSDLLGRTGSRYAPAAPCAALGLAETADNPLVFIGKPCDIAGLRKTQIAKPDLQGKVGLALGIFCAGTPSTQATLDLLKLLKIDAAEVREVGYRGRGWPGNFRAALKGNNRHPVQMPYAQAWNFLEKYRPYRCYLCPDATAEMADISCGDPWYRQRKEGDQGFSLVLARTERGREVLRGAIQAGYVTLEPRTPQVLIESQKGMLEKRGAIWGRLATMKAFGVPIPDYGGFHLYENWKKLSSREKVKSILGTGKRIVQRKYFRPQGPPVQVW
jgi:coenzyme F420 hydrogenase subunit beta